ncbi:MAG: hypothetical protein AAGC93_25215 [Cyanobacteria bacterium P01_F01_bin.53]
MTQNSSRKEMLIGLGSLFFAHVVFVVSLVSLLWITDWLSLYMLQPIISLAVFGIGLSQLIYAVPLGLRFRRKRRFSAMKGVIIGAVITALLCGGCFVFFLWMLSSMYG